MEYRNPKWSINDWIDCEINHPELGWIPFTCNPDDKGAQFDVAELYNQMKEDPAILPYVPPPPDVPESITRRQCSMQLLNIQMITSDEAIAMAQTGTPPSSVMPYINALEEPQRTMAIIDFAAENYFRNNPLLISLMEASGMTPQQVDEFFIAASQL